MDTINKIIDYLNNITNVVMAASESYVEKISEINFGYNNLILKSIGLFRYLAGDVLFYLFIACIYIGVALMVFKIIQIVLETVSKIISMLW